MGGYAYIIVALATAGSLATLAAVGAAEEPNHVDEFMNAKLGHAQKVLEGLTREDYDTIIKHSQELTLLSQAASWQVLQTAQYLQYSGEFRSATQAMTRAAKEKDLETATMAYMAMTLKCINCHKYVRRVGTAGIQSETGRRLTHVPGSPEEVFLRDPSGRGDGAREVRGRQ